MKSKRRKNLNQTSWLSRLWASIKRETIRAIALHGEFYIAQKPIISERGFKEKHIDTTANAANEAHHQQKTQKKA
jgi:hypothetical protein